MSTPSLSAPASVLLAGWTQPPQQQLRQLIAKGISIYVLMWAMQDKRCFYCPTQLNHRKYHPRSNRGGWTKDHVIPRCKGAGNTNNIVLSCSDCNQRKGDRSPSWEELERAAELQSRFRAIAVPKWIKE